MPSRSVLISARRCCSCGGDRYKDGAVPAHRMLSITNTTKNPCAASLFQRQMPIRHAAWSTKTSRYHWKSSFRLNTMPTVTNAIRAACIKISHVNSFPLAGLLRADWYAAYERPTVTPPTIPRRPNKKGKMGNSSHQCRFSVTIHIYYGAR